MEEVRSERLLEIGMDKEAYECVRGVHTKPVLATSIVEHSTPLA